MAPKKFAETLVKTKRQKRFTPEGRSYTENEQSSLLQSSAHGQKLILLCSENKVRILKSWYNILLHVSL